MAARHLLGKPRRKQSRRLYDGGVAHRVGRRCTERSRAIWFRQACGYKVGRTKNNQQRNARSGRLEFGLICAATGLV
jgi:hypothetical protein